MEFRDSPETEAFRQQVRAWINSLEPGERNLPAGPEAAASNMAAIASVRRKLAERGWAAPAWPAEYGGMGATVRQQAVFNEELAYHGVPGPDFIAINYVGPTLMLYGTPEQKHRFLPPILRGEEIWCQGYSEPGAGSDLASLQTRAEVRGDDFLINGQKIWTSNAHRADWMFCLVRTDPAAPKHRGISYLLIDMRSPGIEVRPLVNMAGSHEFNEVFFSDVVVPRQNLVGELNRGWYVGMATLDFERSAIGLVASIRRDLEGLVEAFKSTGLPISPQVRAELADRFIETEVIRTVSHRIIFMQEHQLVPNYEASMAKVFTTELNQRIARTGARLLGLSGQLWAGGASSLPTARWVHHYLRTVANTIEGGSSEIQRNIIATRGLGLPRG
jgi:alkylation response protein AidB-like acyl-CoA dehydrogenase